MKRITLIVLSCAFTLLCLSLHADPVVKLNNLMSELKTLDVNFHLEIRGQKDNELFDENSGSLTVQRPGYFHVHTKEPFEQYIISDRKVIWTYDVELEQATQEPVDDRLQQTPFLLLSGNIDAIRKNFSVKEPIVNGISQRFELSPQDANASYENVILQFENDILTGMTWDTSLEEKNSIRFSDIKINQKLSETLFNFQPPPGVEVVINSSAVPTIP